MILMCRRYSRSFEGFTAAGGQVCAGLAEGGGSAGGDRGVRTVRMDEQQVSRSAGEEGAGRLMFCLCLTVYNAHFFFTFSSL